MLASWTMPPNRCSTPSSARGRKRRGGPGGAPDVLESYGVPIALYTDRAHWAVHTPAAGGARIARRPTQVGRALARLGIEHILGYSPQARGRSERANRTLQGRLVNECGWPASPPSPPPIAICASTSSGLQCRVRPRPRLTRLRVRPGGARGPRPDPLRGRRTGGRRDNVVTARSARLAAQQAARAPHLCRPARPRAPPPQWPPFRLVRRPLPWAVRSRGRPLGGRYPMPLTERSFHGVKQLRPDHVSATGPNAPAGIWTAGAGRAEDCGRHTPLRSRVLGPPRLALAADRNPTGGPGRLGHSRRRREPGLLRSLPRAASQLPHGSCASMPAGVRRSPSRVRPKLFRVPSGFP